MNREIQDIGTDGVDELLRLWILGNKAERNRGITRMHLIGGKTYEEIAEAYGMSSRRVGSICRKCENIIALHTPLA